MRYDVLRSIYRLHFTEFIYSTGDGPMKELKGFKSDVRVCNGLADWSQEAKAALHKAISNDGDFTTGWYSGGPKGGFARISRSGKQYTIEVRLSVDDNSVGKSSFVSASRLSGTVLKNIHEVIDMLHTHLLRRRKGVPEPSRCEEPGHLHEARNNLSLLESAVKNARETRSQLGHIRQRVDALVRTVEQICHKFQEYTKFTNILQYSFETRLAKTFALRFQHVDGQETMRLLVYLSDSTLPSYHLCTDQEVVIVGQKRISPLPDQYLVPALHALKGVMTHVADGVEHIASAVEFARSRLASI